MKQFNQLPQLNSASNDDIIPIQTTEGLTYKIAKGDFLTGITGGSSLQFDFKFPGDKQGLIYYLGTAAYTQAYVNPAKNGIITTSEISKAFSNTGMDEVFSRDLELLHTGNSSNAWGQVDLGSSRSFLCKYYTITARQDDTVNNLRNWVFQGSNNGNVWTNLHSASGRNDFNKDSVLTFDLRENATAYRYYRILQTGVNSNGTNFLCFSELEFYGNLV